MNVGAAERFVVEFAFAGVARTSVTVSWTPVTGSGYRVDASSTGFDGATTSSSDNANIGYFAQDNSSSFAADMALFEWMSQWKKNGDDEQAVRGILGKMLFSQNEVKKSVKVISGGEQSRMMFGKLMMQQPNIMLMDEPTNHMDMETIEALNTALENYPGTLIFVSHDREFVSSIATRIIEFTPNGIIDYSGDYEQYLSSQAMEKGEPVY